MAELENASAAAKSVESATTAATASEPGDDGTQPKKTSSIVFATRFQGQELVLDGLQSDANVGDLKALVEDETAVPAKRQKLIGLCKGRLPSDEQPLSSLGLRGGPPFRFTLMGTPDDKLFVDPCDRDDLPEVLDDLDVDADFELLSARWHRSRRNAAQLAKFTASTTINWIAPRRPGKHLLVLDLDHTLLDFSRRDEAPLAAAKRPHLDAFLRSSYEHYDLVIWSQTSWRWLEVKLTELGLLASPHFKICFVLDKTSMFSIISRKRDGSEFKHAVKPLQLIWAKEAAWSAANTVHVDDLSRNFALNPKSGLKCRAYHRSAPDAAGDVELPLLAAYLAHVATAAGGPGAHDHGAWRKRAASLCSRASSSS